MNLELLLLAFYEFFKTGLFALGGGLATIPFLTEMMNKYHWFTADMLTDMIAVSESTPGAIGINMATYTGYQWCAGWYRCDAWACCAKHHRDLYRCAVSEEV